MFPTRSLIKKLGVAALVNSFALAGHADFTPTDSAGVVLGQPSADKNFMDAANQHTAANSLYYPWGVTACGNWMFVADYYNQRVVGYYKDSDNPLHFKDTATLVLGKSDLVTNAFTTNQFASKNTLYYPTGLHCDGTNLYVMDTSYNRVLIFKNAGTLPEGTTGTTGADIVLGQDTFDAQAIGAGMKQMNNPGGVWRAGDKIFVADAGNNRVLIFSTTTVFNDTDGKSISADVVLGGGADLKTPGTSSTLLRRPGAVYSDGIRLFVSDTNNHRILYWSSIPTTNNTPADAVFGQPNFTTGDIPPVNAYTFYQPYALSYANGQLIVADHSHLRLVAYDVTDLSSPAFWNPALNQPQPHIIGQGAADYSGSTPTSERLWGPLGFYVPPGQSGTYFISDYNNHRVVKYSADKITEAWGQATIKNNNPNRGPQANGLRSPNASAVGAGKTFVADYYNHRVLIYNSMNPATGASADDVLGQVSVTSNDLDPFAAPTAQSLYYPSDISIDNKRVYVCDSNNHRILYWNRTNQNWGNRRPADGVIGQIDMNSRQAGSDALYYPASVFSDGKRLYVADQSNNRVLVWKIDDSDYKIGSAIILGQPTSTTRATGNGTSQLNSPVRVFSNGIQLFVSDFFNNRVLVWDDVENLGLPDDPKIGKPATFVLGQSGFNRSDPCTDANDDPRTADVPCLSTPYGLTGDGQRLFVSHYSNISTVGNGRVLEWQLPITQNNQKTVNQKLWPTNPAVVSGSSISATPRGLQLYGKDLWLTDQAWHRVLKFTDTRSTYVDMTVTALGGGAGVSQGNVIKAMILTVGAATRNGITKPIQWDFLQARQEGGVNGDIKEILLCNTTDSEQVCGNAPLATLLPTSTPGLFSGSFTNDAVPGAQYVLAYRVANTAQVGLSLGLSLQVNSGFFGFKDKSDGTAAFVNNTNGPDRTSGLTPVFDKPDTLVLVSSNNMGTSEIPQNVFIPFLKFQLKADEDQVVWQSLKLKLNGTANPAGVTAKLSVNNSGNLETVKDNISFDDNGNASLSLSRTVFSTATEFQIALTAGSSTTGTLGVDIDPSVSNPFVVAPLDVAPTFTKFGSVLRTIVSHASNHLFLEGTNLVSNGQTAEQATRVLLGKLKLWTDVDWTYISRWPITRLGVRAPADVENFEFWKDDGDGLFNETKDILIAQAPHDANGLANIPFDPGLRIETSSTTLWVAAKLSANASPHNFAGAALDVNQDTLFPFVCDPNTIPAEEFSLSSNRAEIVASRDTVTVKSSKLSNELAQGDVNRDLLQLKLWTDKNTAEWQSLTVSLEGTATANDLVRVSLFKQEGTHRTLVAQNKFTGQEATLGFSGESLTTSTDTYFLSVDVADLAVDGHTVRLSLATPAALRLKQSADAVSPENFSHTSNIFPIQRFQATLSVGGASLLEGPQEVEIGQSHVFVARLTAHVDKSYADIKKIQVHLSGEGSEATDLVNVALYRSNGDDVINGADQFIVSTPVVQGVASLDLGSERINVSPSEYVIGVTISTTATPDDRLIFSFGTNDMEVFSPAHAVVSNSDGFQAQALVVKEPISSLLLSQWTSLAPSEAFQTNTNVEMAAFHVRMDNYTGRWRSLRLDRTTEANFIDSDVKVIRLYEDVGTLPGHYDSNDRLVAEGAFVGGSATLNFPTAPFLQNLTTTPVGYVLTIDVAGNAKPANAIGFQLSSAGNFDLTPDGVDNTGFPFQTNRTIIRPTVDALDLTNPGTVNVAPLIVTQSDGPIPFLRFNLTAETNQVTWQGLTVENGGTLLDSDIIKVRLYEDLNGNGVPEVGEDVTRGQPSFNQHSVTLRPSADVLVPTSSFGIKKYLVALDFARLAAPGTSVHLKIKDLLVEAPDYVQNAGNLGIGKPNDSIIGDLPDTVTPSVQPLTNLVFSPTLYQGVTDAAVLRIRLRTNEDAALWTTLAAQLNLDSTSPLKPEHFTSFKLFKDANGSGQLDSSETERPIAVGTRLGQEISFHLDTPEVLSNNGQDYFLAVSLSIDAPAGEPLSVTLKDANAMQIASPDKLSWLAAMNSLALRVRNVKAPSTPVVADYEDSTFARQDFLNGTYTPPDVAGRGQFTPSAIQFPFTWGSQMAPNHGGLGSAEYCVGTTPGACNAHDWTTLKPEPGVAMAKGLNLAHGTTYYVSIRAKSSQYGALSDIGVSNGILVDLARPQRPVANEPSIEDTGYSLLWQPVSPTLSGLPGYILEERSESKPTWKPLGAVRPGLERPELTTDGLSHTMVDKKPGTYYYRIVAVNGVGTRSDPSNVVRVDFALAQAPTFISEAVNFPNPFDAKNGPTAITYTLKAPSDVQLRLYDGFGREVREDRFSAGTPGATGGGNTFYWDGNDGENRALPQGTYVIRLNAGGEDVRWKIGVWR
jgi:hypothetical protein